MVLTDEGVEMLRDVISSDLSSGQAGTGTIPARQDQTALSQAVSATLNALSTNIKSSNTINMTHVVTTAEANGSTLSEWEILGSSDTVNYNRLVLSGLLKNSQTEITMIQVFALERI